jgi:hypothetical protein
VVYASSLSCRPVFISYLPAGSYVRFFAGGFVWRRRDCSSGFAFRWVRLAPARLLVGLRLSLGSFGAGAIARRASPFVGFVWRRRECSSGFAFRWVRLAPARLLVGLRLSLGSFGAGVRDGRMCRPRCTSGYHKLGSFGASAFPSLPSRHRHFRRQPVEQSTVYYNAPRVLLVARGAERFVSARAWLHRDLDWEGVRPATGGSSTWRPPANFQRRSEKLRGYPGRRGRRGCFLR